MLPCMIFTRVVGKNRHGIKIPGTMLPVTLWYYHGNNRTMLLPVVTFNFGFVYVIIIQKGLGLYINLLN